MKTLAENYTSTQPTIQVRNYTPNNTVTLESSQTPVKNDTLLADTQQIAKERKANEKELKAREKALNHKSENLQEVTHQLAASRVRNERLQHDLDQQKAAYKLLQESRTTQPIITPAQPTYVTNMSGGEQMHQMKQEVHLQMETTKLQIQLLIQDGVLH